MNVTACGRPAWDRRSRNPDAVLLARADEAIEQRYFLAAWHESADWSKPDISLPPSHETVA
jgi:hypothetical protein